MWLIALLFLFFMWCVISPFMPKEHKESRPVVYQQAPAQYIVIHRTVNNYVDNNYSVHNTQINNTSARSQLEPKYTRSEEGLFGNQNKKERY